MKVEPPDVINATVGATVTNEGKNPITVTATSDTGAQVVFEVPAQSSVPWVPPAGWVSVTFTSPGQEDAFRGIE